MRFNTFKIRLLISVVLATPSYSFLMAIRGYSFDQVTFYGHFEYSAAVFIILILLFEGHHQKSKFLEKRISWKESLLKRFWTESVATILFTPMVVTPVMLILYMTLWDMTVWFPGMLEYNLFALTISFLIGVFVNAEVIIDEWKRSLLENEILEKRNHFQP